MRISFPYAFAYQSVLVSFVTCVQLAWIQRIGLVRPGRFERPTFCSGGILHSLRSFLSISHIATICPYRRLFRVNSVPIFVPGRRTYA